MCLLTMCFISVRSPLAHITTGNDNIAWQISHNTQYHSEIPLLARESNARGLMLVSRLDIKCDMKIDIL